MFRLNVRLRSGATRGGLSAVFGPLEIRVLEALWRHGGSDPTGANTGASVNTLLPDFPHTAYTTLMTTLDRLHRKGVLLREKAGRAFVYTPRCSRAELEASLAADMLGVLLGSGVSTARPALSFFVDALQVRDEKTLDELERLIKERRASLETGQLREEEGEG
jgi:predicted transcriptional regulator